MISSVLMKKMTVKDTELNKELVMFNIMADKYLSAHAGLGVPTARSPIEGNCSTKNTKIEYLWVNDIMMIVIPYRYLCYI